MFIENITKSAIKNLGNRQGYGGKEERPISTPVQFILGHVIECATSSDSAVFDDKERNINAITAIRHVPGKVIKKKDLEGLTTTIKDVFYPLMRGIQDVPTQGDQVLLCNFGGIPYYLGPVNTLNSPNMNVDTLITKEEYNKDLNLRQMLNVNPELEWEPGVKRLQKRIIPELDEFGGLPTNDISLLGRYGVGDLVFEGRFGNSLRLGNRGKWANLILSNGRAHNATWESLSDTGLLSMTHAGTLREHFNEDLQLSCNGEKDSETGTFTIDNENRPITFEDKDIPTLLLQSNRMILNSTYDDMILSSRTNTIIGSGNSLEIMSKNSTTIEASNIYLGRSAKDPDSQQPHGNAENMVLGKTLHEMMDIIVDILTNMKVTGTVGGISGPPEPSTLSKIVKLKNFVDSKDFLSSYHFIEDNGQKPEDNN